MAWLSTLYYRRKRRSISWWKGMMNIKICELRIQKAKYSWTMSIKSYLKSNVHLFRYKTEVFYNPISNWQLPYSGNDSTLSQYIELNDGGYFLFCIIFILLGSSGFILNSRALHSFFHIHRVSLNLTFVIVA